VKHFSSSLASVSFCFVLLWVGFQVDDAIAVITKLINELSSAA
jgi:hypothetical protein